MSNFGTPLRLDQIRDGDRIELLADDADLKAIAERLGLGRLERLDAHAVLSRAGHHLRACGRLRASLEQSCVVTGEPVPAHLDEPFELSFMPEPTQSSPDAEVELKGDDCDVIFHDGATIALGDAIADTLALSLDPYPRSAGAEAVLKEAGVLSEEQAGPFAALARLRQGSGEE